MFVSQKTSPFAVGPRGPCRWLVFKVNYRGILQDSALNSSYGLLKCPISEISVTWGAAGPRVGCSMSLKLEAVHICLDLVLSHSHASDLPPPPSMIFLSPTHMTCQGQAVEGVQGYQGLADRRQRRCTMSCNLEAEMQYNVDIQRTRCDETSQAEGFPNVKTGGQ